MSVARPPTRTPATGAGRAGHRAGRRGRGRLSLALFVVVMLGGAAAGWWFVLRGGGGEEAGGPAGPAPSRLLAVAVLVEPQPFVAVVGAGGDLEPAVAILPGSTAIEIPGLGSDTAGAAARLPGDVFRVALSNLLGAEVGHHAVWEPDGLAEAVDDAGGVTLDVAGTLEVDGRTIGPGPTDVGGAEVAAYLEDARPFEHVTRWTDVLRALLSVEDPVLGPAVHADDPAAASEVWAAARGATVTEVPTEESGGALLRPDFEAMPGFVAEAFGIGRPPPVPVLVLNGNGAPGVGEQVARLLVPEGFRVVASENARSFDHRTTEIRVGDPALEEAAGRVAAALGVGEVILGEPGSGLADITILVGMDFLEA
ncbi:MAG: LytR C-terminal domain-containing protein [Actinobacteria bacterium]|nr:LytR C-terminal domain-containing protein [Actinomycetota bacterium]